MSSEIYLSLSVELFLSLFFIFLDFILNDIIPANIAEIIKRTIIKNIVIPLETVFSDVPSAAQTNTFEQGIDNIIKINEKNNGIILL